MFGLSFAGGVSGTRCATSGKNRSRGWNHRCWALGDDEGGGVGLIELYGRYGVSPRFEIGARTTGFLAAEGIVLGAVMMEGKYQFVTRSPQVAVGMGVSYYGLELEDERFIVRWACILPCG